MYFDRTRIIIIISNEKRKKLTFLGRLYTICTVFEKLSIDNNYVYFIIHRNNSWIIRALILLLKLPILPEERRESVKHIDIA